MTNIYTLLLVFMALNQSIFVTYIPGYDTIVARALVQIIVGVLGVFVLSQLRVNLFSRYGIFFVYLFTNALSATFSNEPLLVLLHTGALGAIIIFSIAYAETNHAFGRTGNFPVGSMVAFLGLVCVSSLILQTLAPGMAYLGTAEGPRFRGIFGQPGSMAPVAAILLGVSVLGRVHPILRYSAIGVAGASLFLTGSRTYWVATIVALVFSALVFRRIKLWKGVGFFSLAILLGALFLTNLELSVEMRDLQRISRWQSLESLSGRVVVWQQAFEYFLERPVLGYGFTRGSDSFFINRYHSGADGAAISLVSSKVFTLHNGYIQSLLDGGVVSFIPYVLIIAMSWVRLIRLRSRDEFGVIFYICTCLALANLGQSEIYSASVFPSVLFWSVAVLSFSCRAEPRTEQVAYLADAHPENGDGGIVTGHG